MMRRAPDSAAGRTRVAHMRVAQSAAISAQRHSRAVVIGGVAGGVVGPVAVTVVSAATGEREDAGIRWMRSMGSLTCSIIGLPRADIPAAGRRMVRASA